MKYNYFKIFNILLNNYLFSQHTPPQESLFLSLLIVGRILVEPDCLRYASTHSEMCKHILYSNWLIFNGLLPLGF